MEKAIMDGFEWIDLDLEEISTRKTRRAYSKARKVNDVMALKARTRILRKCLFIMAVVLGMVVGCIISIYSTAIESYKAELDNRITAQRTLEIEVEDLTKQYNNDIIVVRDYANQVAEENVMITDKYNRLLEDYNVLASRAELYDKYSYAIEGTDITIDQVKNLEALCQNSKICDTDFILATALVESEGIADNKNSESTAKGYGQFLNSTSKFVYTDLLGYSDWTPEVAYDPNINFEMMVAYFDYLYESTGSLEGAINSYRGSYNPGYYAEINKWLALSNKSIDTISK